LPMASPGWLEEVRQRAKAALAKPAAYGRDVDVTQFGDGRAAPDEVAVAAAVEKAGVSTAAQAYYIQADNAYFRYLCRIPGVEVYRLEEFVETHRDLVRDYLWRLVPPPPRLG
jgi:hypothetical protein